MSEQVREQQQKFEADLPALLAKHPGKLAVYFDGLRGVFDDEWQALAWASKNLGDDTPFVIAEIAPPREILLTAALAFGAGS